MKLVFPSGFENWSAPDKAAWWTEERRRERRERRTKGMIFDKNTAVLSNREEREEAPVGKDWSKELSSVKRIFRHHLIVPGVYTRKHPGRNRPQFSTK